MNPSRKVLRRPGSAGAGLLLLVWSLLSAGCASTSSRPAAGSSAAPAGGYIAVMSAFAPEVAANEAFLLGSNAPVSVTRLHGVEFKHVRYAGHDLLLFASGMSLVNAALTTEMALDHFPIRAVLFAGVAGGIDPARHIGDVVVPERWYHHSEAVYANPRPDGAGYVLPSFFTPRHENFGYVFPNHVAVIREGLPAPVEQPFFAADPALLDVARRAVASVPPLPARGRMAQVTVGGAGLSGPVFMDNREYRKWAFRVWQAQCLDMESTAIGQVCWVHRTPFLIVRALSDLAGGQEGVNDVDQTEVAMSRHAATVLREVIRALPDDPGNAGATR